MDCIGIIKKAVQMAEKNGFKMDRETLDNLKAVAKKLEGDKRGSMSVNDNVLPEVGKEFKQNTKPVVVGVVQEPSAAPEKKSRTRRTSRK